MNEVTDAQPDVAPSLAPPLPPLVPLDPDPKARDLASANEAPLACRNCGFSFAALGGKVNFCPSCGQDTHPHAPSAWEFIHEFITHYVALEGKLWRTLGLLFFKPGQLSIEYRAGKKVHYVAPLRLYITASFLFFLVVKIAGWGNIVQINTGSESDSAKVATEVSSKAGPAKPVASTAAQPNPSGAAAAPAAELAPIVIDRNGVHRFEKPSSVKPGEIPDEVLKAPVKTDLDCGIDETFCRMIEGRISQKWQGRTGKDITAAIKQSTLSNMPYALFFMLPMFAWLTSLVFWRRKLTFGEHMVYAFHVHAFTFFMLLAKAQLPRYVGDIVIMLGCFYYFIAMQRYFGGRWWLNIFRYGFIGTAYTLAIIMLTAVVIILSLYF